MSNRELNQKLCQLLDLLTDGIEIQNTHVIEGCVEVNGEIVDGFVIVDDSGAVVTGPLPTADLGFADCCPPDELNAFDLTGIDNTDNSKFNLDDPTFTNAYGDIGAPNWTAGDVAAALNAAAANATPPTVPSGIDYSTTVWGASGNMVYVVSGPIPTTLDLVSINVSLPLSATI